MKRAKGKYVPKYLEIYKRPDSYAGPTHYGYYPVLSQNRDSGCLERSNFRSTLKALGGEGRGVQVIRDTHWASGWVETIYVAKTAVKRLQIADKIMSDLEGYPAVDEADFSELETEIQAETWNSYYDLREKIKLCAENGISIFSARQSYPPSRESGECVVIAD
jgi:hypothetical protein